MTFNAALIGVIALVAVLGVALAIIRARKPLTPPSPCCTQVEEEPIDKPATRGAFARLWQALTYLRTRRAWRYRMPWVLIVGADDSGRTSLAHSAGLSEQILSEQQRDALQTTGTHWHLFSQGAVIDLDSGANESGLVRALKDLEDLRPERALDGLLLTISARTLLQSDIDTRKAAADAAYRQLNVIQSRLEFVLPVYVVVTECDVVNGFSAFWRALPEAMRKQIFGWSTPANMSDAGPASWAQAAFSSIDARLQSLELHGAASESIEDADHFVLFPRHFQRLATPATSWLTTVFQETSWQASFIFRGIFFTGSTNANGVRQEGVRRDVSFVDDLFAQKILAEKNLARPTRQSLWSRNRILRAAQYLSVVVLALALLALATASYQLQRQVSVLHDALTLLNQIPTTPQRGQACIGEDQVYPLVSQIAQIDMRFTYWAIPLSWIDSRVTQTSSSRIADAAFSRVIMPSLACQLELRARELMRVAASDTPAATASAYQQELTQLANYLDSAVALEENTRRFNQLAGNGASGAKPRSEQERMRLFEALSHYAYGTPLPAAVKQERGALSAALSKVEYSAVPYMPSGLHTRVVNQATVMGSGLQRSLLQEVGIGASLLVRLEQDEQQVAPLAQHFTRWLDWIRSAWLGSSDVNNPCEDVRTQFSEQTGALVRLYGYPATLSHLLDHFNAQHCYQPAMRTLTSMQLPPYGMLFTQASGALDLNPALQPELSGLTALLKQDFMQQTQAQPFTCTPGMSGWRDAEVVQANTALRQYAAFLASQDVSPTAQEESRPLFDRVARRQLVRVVDDTMLRAQRSDTLLPDARSSGVQANALADQQLAQQSQAFGSTLEPMLTVLRQQMQFGLLGSAQNLTQCVRDFASDALGRLDALAGMSKLYDPGNNGTGTALFDLGSTAVTLDYLSRQIARSQVLAGYATPFVGFLQNTASVNDVQRSNVETAPYWSNTIDELNRYTQFKETAGQVANLHNLFLKEFTGMNDANCSQTLAAYQPALPGNDFYSQRRIHLEEQSQWRCDDRHAAQAMESWRDLRIAFERDLAHRYPFGPATQRDADPMRVKAFFNDYATRAPALRQYVSHGKGKQFEAARAFLDQLDAAASFFGPTLLAQGGAQPVNIQADFSARAEQAEGANQIIRWSLASGGSATQFPHAEAAVLWEFGKTITLKATWADRSQWRPVASADSPGIMVDAATAQTSQAGPWALLRLVEQYRASPSAREQTLNPDRIFLQLPVALAPIQATQVLQTSHVARLYLSLDLVSVDAKTQAQRSLQLPMQFPRTVPDLKARP